MAKMSRGNLKSLVKECLFEILLEASGDNPIVEGPAQARKTLGSKKKSSTRNRVLGPTVSNEPTERRPRSVDVSHLTEDPIMTAIFQDTAATTLVEQADAERGRVPRGKGDAASLTVAQSDPSQLFGAASENWAALAFNDK